MPVRKPLFQLTTCELAELMQSIDSDLRAQNLKDGFYNVYGVDTSDKSVLVRDYADKTEFVHVDAATGNSRTFRRHNK